MPADIRGRAVAPILQHRPVARPLIQDADVQRMVTQFMPHPAVADLDVYVQHGQDTVHQTLALVVQKAEAGAGYDPQTVGPNHFLYNRFVVILDGADARSTQPALVAADTVRNLHVGCVDDLHIFFWEQSADLVAVDACAQSVQNEIHC